jgi:hypothetical protein
VGVAALTGAWPPSASARVRDARDAYLAASGLSASDYDAARFEVRLLGLRWRFPNLPTRRRAVPLHDLHHVATGYSSGLAGEAQIGAWELRCGCPNPAAFVLNALAVALGGLVAPACTWRAWRRARGQRTLYRLGRADDELLDLSVGELRRRLGLPQDGCA